MATPTKSGGSASPYADGRDNVGAWNGVSMAANLGWVLPIGEAGGLDDMEALESEDDFMPLRDADAFPPLPTSKRQPVATAKAPLGVTVRTTEDNSTFIHSPSNQNSVNNRSPSVGTPQRAELTVGRPGGQGIGQMHSLPDFFSASNGSSGALVPPSLPPSFMGDMSGQLESLFPVTDAIARAPLVPASAATSAPAPVLWSAGGAPPSSSSQPDVTAATLWVYAAANAPAGLKGRSLACVDCPDVLTDQLGVECGPVAPITFATWSSDVAAREAQSRDKCCRGAGCPFRHTRPPVSMYLSPEFTSFPELVAVVSDFTDEQWRSAVMQAVMYSNEVVPPCPAWCNFQTTTGGGLQTGCSQTLCPFMHPHPALQRVTDCCSFLSGAVDGKASGGHLDTCAFRHSWTLHSAISQQQLLTLCPQWLARPTGKEVIAALARLSLEGATVANALTAARSTESGPSGGGGTTLTSFFSGNVALDWGKVAASTRLETEFKDTLARMSGCGRGSECPHLHPGWRLQPLAGNWRQLAPFLPLQDINTYLIPTLPRSLDLRSHFQALFARIPSSIDVASQVFSVSEEVAGAIDASVRAAAAQADASARVAAQQAAAAQAAAVTYALPAAPAPAPPLAYQNAMVMGNGLMMVGSGGVSGHGRPGDTSLDAEQVLRMALGEDDMGDEANHHMGAAAYGGAFAMPGSHRGILTAPMQLSLGSGSLVKSGLSTAVPPPRSVPVYPQATLAPAASPQPRVIPVPTAVSAAPFVPASRALYASAPAPAPAPAGPAPLERTENSTGPQLFPSLPGTAPVLVPVPVQMAAVAKGPVPVQIAPVYAPAPAPVPVYASVAATAPAPLTAAAIVKATAAPTRAPPPPAAPLAPVPVMLKGAGVPEGLGIDGTVSVGTNTNVILAASNIMAKRTGRSRCPDWFVMKKFCPRGETCPMYHLRLCPDDRPAQGGGQCAKNKVGKCDMWHFRPVHMCRAYLTKREPRDCKYGHSCTYLHVAPIGLGLPELSQDAPIPPSVTTEARRFLDRYEGEMGSVAAILSTATVIPPMGGGRPTTLATPFKYTSASAAAASGAGGDKGGGARPVVAARAPAPAPAPAAGKVKGSAAKSGAGVGKGVENFYWRCKVCTFSENDVLEDVCQVCECSRNA